MPETKTDAKTEAHDAKPGAPKVPLYRLRKQFTAKEPVRDPASGEQLFELETESEVERDGKKITLKRTVQMPGSKLDVDQQKSAKALWRDVEQVIPAHWAPWVVTADGEYRTLRPGDECTLRDDYVTSLGDQIEPVNAAAAPTSPAPVLGKLPPPPAQ